MTKTDSNQSPKADVYSRVTAQIFADLEKGHCQENRGERGGEDDRAKDGSVSSSLRAEGPTLHLS